MLSQAEVLSVEPEVRPTPLAALSLENAPTELHFVRSHFPTPAGDPRTWTLTLGGATEHAGTFTLAELQERPARTATVVLECAGHRRDEFEPATDGVQWSAGAVSEARWTGVPLSDLLLEAGPTSAACEVLFEAPDHGAHWSSPDPVSFVRSIPLARALEGDVLVAWEMNGEPIPAKHGGPLRLIVPGSYAVASVKWLNRITVLDRPYSGAFQGVDYQIDGVPLHEMPVNSLIVAPEDGALVAAGSLEVSGVAWGGSGGIAAVDVRACGGAWHAARLHQPDGPAAFARWSVELEVPRGEQQLEVRARDHAGAVQPERAAWNELGYTNNGFHAVRVTAG